MCGEWAMSATQTTAMPVGAVLADGVRGSAYAELSRQIRQAGLLRRRRGYYAARIAVTAAGFAVGWAVFVLVGDSWWQPAVAVWLAVAFMQLGFVGHDAGHQQIFRRRWANNLVGLACGNLGIGLSYAWWMDKHNRHHAHPNQEGRDPVLAVDDDSDYLRRQVLTARNVSGGWLVDTALGGLNYQIEHHLFPSMPRPNLRHAQQMIRTFCHHHDLPYVQTSLFGSWAKVLRYLHTIGRRPDAGPGA